MAADQLAVQEYHRDATALAPTYTSASSNGHEFDNTDGDVLLLVKNVSGASVNLIVDQAEEVDGTPVQKTIACADTTSTAPCVIGPFPTSYYNDSSEEVQITWSSTGSVSVAAVKPKD